MPKSTIVITYGTFDLFHVGHVRLLQRLRNLGDQLYVGCSTDEFNKLKGKNVIIPFTERKEILSSCKYVDHVFAEECWEQKKDDIVNFGASIFAIGDDWSGHFDFLEDICQVVYLPRTPDISSTRIKKFLASRLETEITSIISEVVNVENRLRAIRSE